MRFVLETVTPELAAQYLANAHKNRPRRRGYVEFLTDEINRGQFLETHQTPAFDKHGRLFDGQHRMEAVVRSGKTVKMWVCRDANPETFRVIDSGVARSAGDRVSLVDHPGQNQIACSLVRSYIMSTNAGKGRRIAVDLIEEAFLKMPDSFAWVAESWSHKVPGLTRSDIGAGVVSYHAKHPSRCEEFVDAYKVGDGVATSAPTALRNACFTRKISYGQIHAAYWKAISATKAYHEDRPFRMVTQATVDWQGNKFGPRAKSYAHGGRNPNGRLNLKNQKRVWAT